MTDSPEYQDKLAFFNRVLTVYGRKPVLETLRNGDLACHALHLAQSNREDGIIAEIRRCARERGITIQTHSREALARISKNGRQDQGVAVDVVCPGFRTVEEFLDSPAPRRRRVLALEGITNPANLGMIIRAATAGGVDGILLARKGNAALGPLVIKASAGTLYRAPLLLCAALPAALRQCQSRGAEICAMAADAAHSLFQHQAGDFCIYVLGNETDGVSAAVRGLADTLLSIPMRGGVESLNVAVAASLVAYRNYLER